MIFCCRGQNILFKMFIIIFCPSFLNAIFQVDKSKKSHLLIFFLFTQKRFSPIRPIDQFSQLVAMSVCLFVCLFLPSLYHFNRVEWRLSKRRYFIIIIIKTLRESQNAALRTSHRLSNFSFQKYYESFIKFFFF